MADAAPADGKPTPRVVEYHPVTGVPEEFHEYLNKETEAYKRLKQSHATSTSDAAASEMTDLKLDTPAVVEEKVMPGKKKKPKAKEIVVTRATRQRKKAITSVEGLDLFGVKLADAAKVCGKKYACGASVVQNASLRDQIDIQGDVQEEVPKLLIEKYGKTHGVEAKNVVLIVDKQRVPFEDY